MIARGARSVCPLCAQNPAIKRRDAALPWVFWRRIHDLRRRPLAGGAIDTLFGVALAELDIARLGARRLIDWATGGDEAAPSAAGKSTRRPPRRRLQSHETDSGTAESHHFRSGQLTSAPNRRPNPEVSATPAV
jgi:hypothetical protein